MGNSGPWEKGRIIECCYCDRRFDGISSWSQLGQTFMDNQLTYVFKGGEYYRFEGSGEYWCNNDTPYKRRQREWMAELKRIKEDAERRQREREESKKKAEEELLEKEREREREQKNIINDKIKEWNKLLQNTKESNKSYNIEPTKSKLDDHIKFRHVLKQPDDHYLLDVEEKKNLDIRINELNTEQNENFEDVQDLISELEEFEKLTKNYLDNLQAIYTKENDNITTWTLNNVLDNMYNLAKQENTKLLIELKTIVECQTYEPNKNIQSRSSKKCVEFWNKLETLVDAFIDSGNVYLHSYHAFLIIITQIMQNPSNIAIDKNIIDSLKQIILDAKTNNDKIDEKSDEKSDAKNSMIRIDEYFTMTNMIPHKYALRGAWNENKRLYEKMDEICSNLQKEIKSIAINDDVHVDYIKFESRKDQIDTVIRPHIAQIIKQQQSNIDIINLSRCVTGIDGDSLIDEFIEKMSNLDSLSITNSVRKKTLKITLSTFSKMIIRCNKKYAPITIKHYFKQLTICLDRFIEPLEQKGIMYLNELAEYNDLNKFENDLLPYLTQEIKRPINNRERRKLLCLINAQTKYDL